MKEYEFVLSSGKVACVRVHGEPNMSAVKKAVEHYARDLLEHDSSLIHVLEQSEHEKMSDAATSDKGHKKTKKRVTQKGEKINDLQDNQRNSDHYHGHDHVQP